MAKINLGRVKGSTWYSGTADSDAAIKQQVTAPLDGDFYFSEESGNVWNYTGGIWNNISNLKGSQGDKGTSRSFSRSGSRQRGFFSVPNGRNKKFFRKFGKVTKKRLTNHKILAKTLLTYKK